MTTQLNSSHLTEGAVRVLIALVLSHGRNVFAEASCAPSWSAAKACGCPLRLMGDTSVASTASWAYSVSGFGDLGNVPEARSRILLYIPSSWGSRNSNLSKIENVHVKSEIILNI